MYVPKHVGTDYRYTVYTAWQVSMDKVGSKHDDVSQYRNRFSTPLRLNMKIIRLSLLLVVLSNTGCVLSKTTFLFALSGIVSGARAPVSPLILSSLTNYVTPDRIGELFGAISLLHTISRPPILAPMQFIYSLTLSKALRLCSSG